MKQLLTYIIACGLLAGCAPKKYLYYNELKNDLSNKNFSNILIVGTGTSGTNLFLETLSEELKRRLKDQKIEITYHHLGNNQTEANYLFKEIVAKAKFDAVLQFAQLDETHNPIILHSGTGSVPTGNGTMFYSYESRNIRFKQKFLMRYFDFSDLSHSMIDVNLDVNIDFINPLDYTKLSDYIIYSLKIE
ncbi:MAG: hypothetical protein WDN26_19740 [Chitinophagaceae bacterium]